MNYSNEIVYSAVQVCRFVFGLKEYDGFITSTVPEEPQLAVVFF
jgi:hypothetical protein